MKYNYLTDKTLQRIEQIIIESAHPDKLVLFGSRARGEITGESDYDILIIKDRLQNERTITKKINRALLDEHLNTSVDLIATSTENWNKNIQNIAYIYKHINAEGIVLYG